MTFVDDKIKALSLEEREKFGQTLRGVLEDDEWLSLRDFDGDNYSLDMVKLTLYREMYEGNFFRLKRNSD